MKKANGEYEWTMYGVVVRVSSSQTAVRLPGGVESFQTRWRWVAIPEDDIGLARPTAGHYHSRWAAKSAAKRWLKSKGFDQKEVGSPRSADNSGSPSETGAG